MINKKFIMLTVFLALLFAVPAVCAADNSTFDVLKAQDYNEEMICESDNVPVFDDNDTLTVSQDDLCENSYDENVSISETDVVLEKDDESAQKSESPLYGIVDIGANSMKLEIYKIKDSGKPKSVLSLSEKSVTSIYVENNNLTKEGIDELVSVLKDFDEVMNLVNVKTKFVFATASLRKIDNSAEVIATVKKKVGLDINLLSGEKEANTTFNSVKDSELTTDKGIVIDLGGGSCEVIDFVNREKVTSESMPIGAESSYQEYVSGMFPNQTEIINIKNRVLSELDKLVVDNSTQRDDLFGIGGSVKKIKKVLQYLGYIDDDSYIQVSMLDDLLNEFREPTRENYEKILNVDAERVNTFLPGLIITKTIAEYFNVTYLHFCKNGVREGILMEILENESHGSQNKQNVSLDVADIILTSDENVEIPIVLAQNATGTVTVKLADNVYTASLLNGSCIIVLPKLESGNHSAKITYSGDDNYMSNKTKINIHVKSASLDAHDMTRSWNSGYDYQVKLVDENGNGIANKLISFTVLSNQYFAMTDEEGIANVRANLNEGTYSVFVSSEIAGNATRTLKIVNRIENNNDLTVYYAGNAEYKVRIIGDDGNPESEGKNVAVLIDNKMQNLKTDKNGFVTVRIDSNFKVGTHSIEIRYNGASAKNKVVVKHLVSLKSASVKKSGKKLVLTASLAKVNGKYLKNKIIVFKFKGKTYKAKTNSKGVAKVSIKKSVLKKLKVGKKVAYQATYIKDTVKKTVKVKR